MDNGNDPAAHIPFLELIFLTKNMIPANSGLIYRLS